MTLKDPHGNLLATSSQEAADAVDTALWRMMSFYDVPIADFERASEADPYWSLPHTMHAGFLLSLTEPSLVAEASRHLERATALAGGAPAREHRSR